MKLMKGFLFLTIPFAFNSWVFGLSSESAEDQNVIGFKNSDGEVGISVEILKDKIFLKFNGSVYNDQAHLKIKTEQGGLIFNQLVEVLDGCVFKVFELEFFEPGDYIIFLDAERSSYMSYFKI